MPTNPELGNDNNLRDLDGKDVGKVDYSGRVSDSWHDRGHINDDGRYIDEYGRDLGWVKSGNSSSNSSVAGDIVGGLLVLLGTIGMQYYSEKKKEVHQKSNLSMPAEYNQVFDLCLESLANIQNCKVEKQDQLAGVILAKAKPTSWWRENSSTIELFIKQNKEVTEVQIYSHPSLFTAAFDGGRNKKIVSAIEDFLHSKIKTKSESPTDSIDK